MLVRRFGPGDYTERPWKNGRGTTVELQIEPPGATLETGFLWRLSMAAVPASGPFSPFPGIDRTLLLLAGNGMELDHGPHGRALLAGPFQPVAFSGDWPTHGRLLDGPCRDFNVMTRRGAVRHRVDILRPGPVPALLPPAPTVLVFCAQGRASLGAEPLAEGGLLRLDGGGGGAIGVRGGPAVLVVVSLAGCSPGGVAST
jgi:environmental stress-induced protein Ves